jgi:hypothetical protein
MLDTESGMTINKNVAHARGPRAAQAACHVPPEEVGVPRECHLRLSWCSHACPLLLDMPYPCRSGLQPTATRGVRGALKKHFISRILFF